MIFQPGDKVRLTHDVGSSFYERNEIYISGTKGSIARILTIEEYFRSGGFTFYDHSKLKSELEKGIRYPVKYEQMMPIIINQSFGFEIIDQCREGGVDLIYAHDLEKID